MQVAESRNLTRAAEMLHISPSALSVQIKNLEEELEVPLFVRQTKGMILTKEGEVLLPHARSVIEKAKSFQYKTGEMRQQYKMIFTIGLNAAPELLKISGIAGKTAAALPGAKIRYLRSSTVDTPGMLCRDIIDVGFVSGTELGPGIHIDFLSQVKVNVVIPRRLLPSGADLDWEQVARLPWIWVDKQAACHAALQKELDRRRLSLNIVSYAEDDSIIRELIRDGQGAALVREDEAHRLVAQGFASVWAPGTVTVPLGLACREEKVDDPLLGIVRQTIIGLWRREDTGC